VGVILRLAGFAASTSVANNIVEQGGVTIDGEVEREWRKKLGEGTYEVRYGSKNRQWKQVTVVRRSKPTA
jgi:ribosome-associated protein YbcJ (S4-like RNA binding protein)